ncbi:hypothetical protein BDY24DRAFT_419125 [Mrakia frigida]|uniref:uncharacterized protein n=1 Tax=Mrakia frigida TaxID=29902 RepID=UPI003FCC1E8F
MDPIPQTGQSLPSAKAEIDELTATASGLLGLSFSPIPITSALPPTTNRQPASRPVAIPTRKSGRRGSESAVGGSIGSSFGGGGGSSLVGGMEKKKSGGGGGGGGGGSSSSVKRETLGTRSSSRSVIAPKVFDFRLADSSTPPPVPTTTSFSSPHTPGSSLLSPRSLPAHVSVLAVNGEDDGEILEDEMKDLKNSKGGKRRSASVFRCESCSKIYRHPSCLVKHRWQHSPHWQESSKLLLSKHQQVQVLEAATILVHLAPNSLPEDKSLWPAAVSPSSHPMPSISFMDSRQRSKATSTHASNLLRQHSNQTATTTTSTNSRSSEEVMSSASSPNSSADGPEDEASSDDDDDILGEEDDEERRVERGIYEKGATDSGYGGSLIKRESHSDAMAVPPPTFAERRTSFGTATALMGRMGLGSLPLRSPASEAALSSSSPYGTSPGTLNFSHPISSSSSYSSSPNNFASGSPIIPGRSSLTAPSNLQYTPLGTSPALPLRSSSLRGTGAFDEEEEQDFDGDGGSYHAVGGGSGSFGGGASLLARAAAMLAEQEEDEEMENEVANRINGGRMEMLKERKGEEEEEEGDWNMDDMEM